MNAPLAGTVSPGGRIHVARHGENAAIGTITIDRPDRANALDLRAARDLRRAGLELCRDAGIRVVVVRGSGGVFCSGADLRYVYDGGLAEEVGYLAPRARPRPAGYGEVLRPIVEYLHSAISELRRAPKPVVAAVDGVAAAGGLGLALACDVVVASERSAFEFAYFRTGLSGGENCTFALPRLLGLRRALDFVMLGERIDAAHAAAMGMVSRVVPDADFDATVADIAMRLAAGPAAAQAAAKQLLNESTGMDRIDAHLDRELEALVRTADSADFAAGLDAFFSKRPRSARLAGNG